MLLPPNNCINNLLITTPVLSGSPPIITRQTLLFYAFYSTMKMMVFSFLQLLFYVAFFIFMFTIFPLKVLYPEHSQLPFDCAVIACSSESIRPGVVQGCKALNVYLYLQFSILYTYCTLHYILVGTYTECAIFLFFVFLQYPELHDITN